jgi:hypothetical protein
MLPDNLENWRGVGREEGGRKGVTAGGNIDRRSLRLAPCRGWRQTYDGLAPGFCVDSTASTINGGQTV